MIEFYSFVTVIQNNLFVLFKFSRHTTLLTIKSSHDAPAPTTVVPTLQDPWRLITTECAFCTMQPPSVRQCTVCEPSAEYSLISAHLWWRGIWRYPLLHTRVLPETTIHEDDWGILIKICSSPFIMAYECWPIELKERREEIQDNTLTDFYDILANVF